MSLTCHRRIIEGVFWDNQDTIALYSWEDEWPEVLQKTCPEVDMLEAAKAVNERLTRLYRLDCGQRRGNLKNSACRMSIIWGDQVMKGGE